MTHLQNVGLILLNVRNNLCIEDLCGYGQTLKPGMILTLNGVDPFCTEQIKVIKPLENPRTRLAIVTEDHRGLRHEYKEGDRFACSTIRSGDRVLVMMDAPDEKYDLMEGTALTLSELGRLREICSLSDKTIGYVAYNEIIHPEEHGQYAEMIVI
jgi:hypothetical protein